jgi:hypothetical protein
MAAYTYDASTDTYVLSDNQSFSVTTDQSDYSPLSTATFTVDGVNAGDVLTFTVTDLNGLPISGTNQPWTITAGADGTLQTTWAVGADAVGQAFLLTVVDQTTGLLTTAGFTDAAYNYTVNSSTPSDAVALGAIFINTAAGPAGTGDFNAFLGIQNNVVEQGYNTDGVPTPLDDKSVPSVHTGSLQLGQVALVNADGTTWDGVSTAYRSFILDINQSGNLGSGASDITLNALQIYLADNSTGGALLATNSFTAGNAFGSDAALVYDLGNNSILLSDHASGSGKFDYQILIPDIDFQGGTDSSYVYLYAKFSGANGGFEEFGVSTPGSTTTGSTPDAVVGIDKQISVDGVHWQDVGLYVPNTDSSAAPTLLTGSAVYYQVLITNNTTPNASDLDPQMAVTSLTDLNGPPLTAVTDATHLFNIGDTDGNGLIGIHETWVYTGSTTAAHGLQLDTATVFGQVTDTNGSTTGSNSDDANYIGVTPKIHIDKVTVDGAASGDNLTILAGESISWKYTVTNTGDVNLSHVTVSDNQLGTLYDSALANHIGYDSQGLKTGVTFTGDDGDGILQTTETWIFTATGTATAGSYNNTGTANGSFTDDASHTATPTSTDDSHYFGADPEIKIVKTTTGSYDVGPDGTLNTGDDLTHTGDNISILAGSNVTWTYTVTTDTTDNVPLSNVIVSDDKLGILFSAALANHIGYDSQGLKDGVTFTGDGGDHILQIGETWTFTATGTAGVGPYSNIGTAKGSFTDTAGHTATDTATDPSSYTGTFTEAQAGRTQGFWGSHTEAWNGLTTDNSKWQKLVGTDLFAAEVNPNNSTLGTHAVQLDPTHSATANAGDVLLGDTNHDGLITGDEVGILVTSAVAKSILSSSVTGDHRITMLQQAIAAQLNIDNHDVNPGDPWSPSNATDKLAGDMITEAVQWLKAYGGSAFSDDVLNTIDYSTSTGKFLTALTATQDASFWTTSRDADGTTNDIHATGEDLKNVLMAFNTNKLVTSAFDQIGWNQNTTDPQHIVNLVGVQANGPDAFWDLAHDNIANFGLTWHG